MFFQSITVAGVPKCGKNWEPRKGLNTYINLNIGPAAILKKFGSVWGVPVLKKSCFHTDNHPQPEILNSGRPRWCGKTGEPEQGQWIFNIIIGPAAIRKKTGAIWGVIVLEKLCCHIIIFHSHPEMEKGEHFRSLCMVLDVTPNC